MFLRLPRILMNAHDVAPNGGGGATPAPAPTPSDPPAQPAAAPIDEATRRAIVDEARNGVFAELRRSGVLPTKTTTPPARVDTPATPAPSPSSSSTDDLVALRGLDRAIGRSGRTLDETAQQRIERDFLTDRPSNPVEWVESYFKGFGIAGSTQAAPAAATTTTPPAGTSPPAPRSAVPLSDRGSPPAPQVPLEEQDLLAMSPSDREALRKQKGDKWFADKFLEQERNRGSRVRLTRR